jgi:NADH-quinone oxidoreductase subunit E
MTQPQLDASAQPPPLLSSALREAILAEVPKYPEARSALLIGLHLIQKELGYVPLQAQREVAALLGILPIQVREVVTFYPMYHEEPVGRRHVQVCVNIACALAGARRLVKGLEDRLGIHVGEVTADGTYSLAEVQCLGSCGTAICVQVNNETYIEGVKPEDVDALLRRLG